MDNNENINIIELEVEIEIDAQTTIAANLSIPEGAEAIVLFAHGSGSGRFSRRNRHVARMLQDRGLATILIDLLTAEEESIDIVTHHLRFDIQLLKDRVIAATKWLDTVPRTRGMKIGYFGASTGAAAALAAAAEIPDRVSSVVSRGGRPDLAKDALELVKAPTLLIVGGNDSIVIELNQAAMEKLKCENDLVIIPGAGHLFELPGKLERVADFAGQWFEHHLLGKEIIAGGKNENRIL